MSPRRLEMALLMPHRQRVNGTHAFIGITLPFETYLTGVLAR